MDPAICLVVLADGYSSVWIAQGKKNPGRIRRECAGNEHGLGFWDGYRFGYGSGVVFVLFVAEMAALAGK